MKKAVDKIDSFLYYKQALERSASLERKKEVRLETRLESSIQTERKSSKSEKRVLTNFETFDNIPKVLTREHDGETKGAVLRAIGKVGTSKAERKLDRVRYSG